MVEEFFFFVLSSNDQCHPLIGTTAISLSSAGFPFSQTLNTNFRRFSSRRSAVGPYSPVAIGPAGNESRLSQKKQKQKQKKSSFPRYACTPRMEEYGKGETTEEYKYNVLATQLTAYSYQIVQHDRSVIYIIIIIANNNNDTEE